MKQAVYFSYKGLAWVVFAVVLVQFFLAVVGVFGEEAYGEEAFAPHAISGLLLVPTTLILLTLTAAAALTRSIPGKRVGPAALLFLLMIAQFMLGGLAQDLSPFVAALHPVNALLLLVVPFTLAHGRRLSQAVEGGAEEIPAATTSRVR